MTRSYQFAIKLGASCAYPTCVTGLFGLIFIVGIVYLTVLAA